MTLLSNTGIESDESLVVFSNVIFTANPLITLPWLRNGGRVHVRLNKYSGGCHSL